MYLVKNKSGLYSPMDESDFEESKSVGVGNVVKATKPRNYLFHKKMFALFKLGFDSQDKFDKFEVYRKIILIKAGYFDIAPTKNGEPYYIPQSLAYENMKAEVFEKCFTDVLDVISKETETAPEQIKSELAGFY